MNGCGGDPRAPIGVVETRTFPTAPTPALAADRLNSAIFDLKLNSPPSDSGIIRIEVRDSSLEIVQEFKFSEFVGLDCGMISMNQGGMQKKRDEFIFLWVYATWLVERG